MTNPTMAFDQYIMQKSIIRTEEEKAKFHERSLKAAATRAANKVKTAEATTGWCDAASQYYHHLIGRGNSPADALKYSWPIQERYLTEQRRIAAVRSKLSMYENYAPTLQDLAAVTQGSGAVKPIDLVSSLCGCCGAINYTSVYAGTRLGTSVSRTNRVWWQTYPKGGVPLEHSNKGMDQSLEVHDKGSNMMIKFQWGNE